jgi:hypothetical protein
VATLSLGDLGTQFSDLNLNFDARELKLQLMLDGYARTHRSRFLRCPFYYIYRPCALPRHRWYCTGLKIPRVWCTYMYACTSR